MKYYRAHYPQYNWYSVKFMDNFIKNIEDSVRCAGAGERAFFSPDGWEEEAAAAGGGAAGGGGKPGRALESGGSKL